MNWYFNPASDGRLIAAILVSGCFFTLSVVLTRIWLKRRFHYFLEKFLQWMRRHGSHTFELPTNAGQVAIAWTMVHWTGTACLMIFCGILGGSWVPALAVCAASIALPGAVRNARGKQRKTLIEKALPGALLFMAGALRSGSALHNAIAIFAREHKGPLADELAQLLNDQRLGMAFDDSLQDAAIRIQLPDFTLFTVAVRVSREVGGNLSDSLTLLSKTLRTKLTMEGRIRALTSQGRLQGIVMTLLPVFLGVVLYFVQPSMGLLLSTSIGWLILACAALLLLIGYLMIRKIVAIDV